MKYLVATILDHYDGDATDISHYTARVNGEIIAEDSKYYVLSRWTCLEDPMGDQTEILSIMKSAIIKKKVIEVNL